jgi:molybdate transport system substrate-binding protein
MKSKFLTRLAALLGLAALLSTGVASAGELRVMISAGFFDVYAELAPTFERATGHR